MPSIALSFCRVVDDTDKWGGGSKNTEGDWDDGYIESAGENDGRE